jgi:hypothetical protein
MNEGGNQNKKFDWCLNDCCDWTELRYYFIFLADFHYIKRGARRAVGFIENRVTSADFCRVPLDRFVQILALKLQRRSLCLLHTSQQDVSHCCWHTIIDNTHRNLSKDVARCPPLSSGWGMGQLVREEGSNKIRIYRIDGRQLSL